MKPISMSAGVLAVVWLLIFAQFASGGSSQAGTLDLLRHFVAAHFPPGFLKQTGAVSHDAASVPQIQKAGAGDHE